MIDYHKADHAWYGQEKQKVENAKNDYHTWSKNEKETKREPYHDFKKLSSPSEK